MKDINNKKQSKTNKPDSSLEERFLELEGQLKKLALDMDAVEDEKLEMQNKMLKALADYQNLERGINDRVEAKLFQIKKQVAASMIEIVDDMKFGNDAREELKMTEEVKAWVDGLVGTMNKVEKALNTLDVLVMDIKVGDEFNAMQHEAIGVVEGKKNNTIAQLIQPGYIMGDIVVRPARVLVIKTP